MSGPIIVTDYPVLVSYAITAQSGLNSTDTTTVNDGYYGSLNSSVLGTYVATGSPSGVNNDSVSTANAQATAMVGAISVITPVTPLLTTYSGTTLTFSPNILYQSATSLTFDASTILNFDAAGNSAGQFFVRATSGSITFSNITMNLLNGAQACNIFWVAGTSMTFTTVPNVYGFLLAGSAITFTTSTTVEGHVYARGTSASFLGSTLINSSCPVVCYLKGTQILTKNGYRRIEDLKVGDPIATLGTIHDNHRVVPHSRVRMVPIVWMGHFNVKVKNSSSLPICIRAHAFANNVPTEDLYVSPVHRIFTGTTMRLARDLVNGTTIFQLPFEPENQDPIVYYHIELPAHSAIVAQGVPSESFYDPTTFRQLFEPSTSTTTASRHGVVNTA